jgi:SAM-dependent MidA family methyltransferase
MLPRERIVREILDHGGWISFARYMELALHARGGYYASGAGEPGAAGDFVTAPELGRLFGRTLARQLAPLVAQGPGLPILELGAGSGALAETLLGELDVDYWILETSAALRSRQEARLGKKVKHLDRLPERWRGIVLANEVADAMPVHLVAWRADGVKERGVAFQNQEFHWQERPATGGLQEEASKIRVPPPYESEIGLAARAWMRALCEHLEHGLILVIDYGFPRGEYYHPQRAAGTLMCHHRHTAHADPFARPGDEDITAHVDFSALAAAARGAGAEVLGFATQAQFLVNCGITEVLGQANVENALVYAPIAAQAQKLLSPAEMGELFKVLAVGKGIATPLLGFSRGDRRHAL